MNGAAQARSRVDYRILTTGQHVMPTYLAFGDTPEGDLTSALGPDLLDGGRVGTIYACVLLETSAGFSLIDTGVPGAGGNGVPPLLSSLDEFGVSPSDISLVILSHAHEDHLGGLLRDGVPVFENAEHLLAEEEWTFWMTGDDPGGLPQEMYLHMQQAAQPYLSSLRAAGLLRLVTGETIPRPGIKVVPAPGHTPGHVAVEVTTAAHVLLYLGDAFLHEAMVTHPTWTGLVDADAETTVATRNELLSRAEQSAAVVAAGHLRGTGLIERTEDGFEWTVRL